MNQNKHNYFHLFSNCITVKGFTQTIIIDYSENNYFFIPNALNDILSLLKKYEIEKVKAKYHQEFNIEIDAFCNNFMEKGSGFYSQTKLNYPPLNKVWEVSYKITNLTLNLNENLSFNALRQLKIDCLGVNLNEYNTATINLLNLTCENIIHNTLQFFIYIDIDTNSLKSIINTFTKLTHIYFLNSNHNTIKNIDGVVVIHSQTKKYIVKNDFTINLPLFTESQIHNTYFNRKLYIGVNGEIKNATETSIVFGNINELENTNDILKIIESKEFQKYWYVHKELIDVCKQCEFRHMCVDNRIPLLRNEKQWYFKTECIYNPYIGKWNDEAGYETLAECGILSDENGFKINRKKLNTINKKLWGDD